MSPDRTAARASRVMLLVEDEQSLLRAFALAFERVGFEVLQAIDVPSALAHWTARNADVAIIVSDVQMPGPPIEDLIARARRDAPRVPILLMSGELRGTEERIQRLLKSVDLFMPKPLRLETLRAEVERRLVASPPN